jgi:hypothetical protein
MKLAVKKVVERVRLKGVAEEVAVEVADPTGAPRALVWSPGSYKPRWAARTPSWESSQPS